MPDVFEKRDRDPRSDLRCEAAALTWLGEATAKGGLPVARPLKATPDLLVEERVTSAPATVARAEAAGRALAHTHAAGTGWWGAPPNAWPDDAPGYWISGELTPVVPEPPQAPESWGAYYARVQVMPQVRELVDARVWGTREAALFGRLCERLSAGDYDAPQPGLLAPAQPARLHGDLWAGNLLFSDVPQGAALIDPMARGGHAEEDLAMLQLFGASHLDRLIAAYDEVSPLADGWRDRVPLMQLQPLLLHCRLYGSGYFGQTLAIARRFA